MQALPTLRRVLILGYHFFPSSEIGARRVTALAQYLIAQGIEPVVVSAFSGVMLAAGATAMQGVESHQILNPRRWGVGALVRLKGTLRSLISRRTLRPAELDAAQTDATPLTSHLGKHLLHWILFPDARKKWTWRAARAAVRAGRRANVQAVVVSGPPMSSLVGAAWAARRLRVPLIMDFRDHWGIDPTDSGGTTLTCRLDRALEGWCVTNAIAITCTTEGIAHSLARRYPRARERLHVVRNGYDGEIQHLPLETGHRLVMLFAGELYVNRDPFPFLAALERLLARPGIDPSCISVQFVGQCESYRGRRLADWLRGKRAASVVQILPPVKAAEVAGMIARATLLINFAQAQPLLVPAKTFEQLASGRESLVLCEPDSETGKLIAGIAGVVRVTPGDDRSLDEALNDLYARHVREGLLTAPAAQEIKQYSRAAQNQKFLDIIARVAGSGAIKA